MLAKKPQGFNFYLPTDVYIPVIPFEKYKCNGIKSQFAGDLTRPISFSVYLNFIFSFIKNIYTERKKKHRVK